MNIAKHFIGLFMATLLLAACSETTTPDPKTSTPANQNNPTLDPTSKTKPENSNTENDDEFVTILLETESAQTVEKPMEIYSDENASKGKAIRIPAGANPEKVDYEKLKGKVVLKCNIPKGGKYKLWARAYWTGSCQNSVRVNIQDQLPYSLSDTTENHWHWVAGKTLKFKPGETVIKLLNREHGIAIDQLILTNDLEYIPEDIVEEDEFL